MSKVFIIGKRQLRLIGVVALLLIMTYSFFVWNKVEPTIGGPNNPRVIHMITAEHATTLASGNEFEVYRWDPGTVPVRKGETVELRILGVNGAHHPFFIEGLNVKGEVTKGKETVVTFTASKEGIYRIVCPTHSDPAHGGPMVGYIVVF